MLSKMLQLLVTISKPVSVFSKNKLFSYHNFSLNSLLYPNQLLMHENRF